MVKINLSNERFGRWLVLEIDPHKKGQGTFWLCVCDCGTRRSVRGVRLRSGHSKSCGCYERDVHGDPHRKHGMEGAPEYSCWAAMIQRCTNPRNHKWQHYGARGITVCRRWRLSFSAFYEDMGTRPRGLSIDRINNDGNYEPGNCRWATLQTQNSNRRGCREHG